MILDPALQLMVNIPQSISLLPSGFQFSPAWKKGRLFHSSSVYLAMLWLLFSAFNRSLPPPRHCLFWVGSYSASKIRIIQLVLVELASQLNIILWIAYLGCLAHSQLLHHVS